MRSKKGIFEGDFGWPVIGRLSEPAPPSSSGYRSRDITTSIASSSDAHKYDRRSIARETVRMLAQRSAQQSLRRREYLRTAIGLCRCLTTCPVAGQPHAFRFTAPAAIATGNIVQFQRRYTPSFLPPQTQRGMLTAMPRLAASQVISSETEAKSILAQQRLHRPVAPHLAIYKAQVTWYLSGLNRITGCLLSGGFYIFGSLYLIAPYIGLHMESAVMAASFAAWPVALKLFTKTLVALPFTFHCMNGIRHLTWDTATMIRNKQVQQTGWAVVGLSVIGALGLALM